MRGFAVAVSFMLLGAVSPAAAVSSPLRAAPDVPCQVFPADNVWNMDVSNLPVHAKSKAWKRSAHAGSTLLHPDFGGAPYGIPFDVVDDYASDGGRRLHATPTRATPDRIRSGPTSTSRPDPTSTPSW